MGKCFLKSCCCLRVLLRFCLVLNHIDILYHYAFKHLDKKKQKKIRISNRRSPKESAPEKKQFYKILIKCYKIV